MTSSTPATVRPCYVKKRDNMQINESVEDVAEAFTAWLEASIEDPNAFNSQQNEINLAIMQADSGEEITYGRRCVETLIFYLNKVCEEA